MALEKIQHGAQPPSYQADRPLLNEGIPEEVNGLIRKDDGFNYLTGLPLMLQREDFKFAPGEVSKKPPAKASETTRHIQSLAARALHLPKSPKTPHA